MAEPFDMWKQPMEALGAMAYSHEKVDRNQYSALLFYIKKGFKVQSALADMSIQWTQSISI